jgi:fructose-bisphosphate aldolase class I
MGTGSMSEDLASIAARLVADGKGILAADESVATLTRRFDPLGIPAVLQARFVVMPGEPIRCGE